MAGWTMPDRDLAFWDGTIKAKKFIPSPSLSYSVSDVTGSRTWDTVYQAGANAILVNIALDLVAAAGVAGVGTFEIGASSPPTTVVGNTGFNFESAIDGNYNSTTTFLVPPNYYYQFTRATTTPTIVSWIETTISQPIT